jgi:hypothetical protein
MIPSVSPSDESRQVTATHPLPVSESCCVLKKKKKSGW